MASQTKENYIKALFHLHQKSEDISLSDLGEKLQVSKPTANDMIKKLKSEGLVTSEKYKPIRITDKGKRMAASIIRRHRLSEMFLCEVMNFGWEEVHEIAEELEHINVEKFFDRMDELLGYPNTDPHGSPIPDKEGNFNHLDYKKLSQVGVGAVVELKALQDHSKEFMLFLNRKQIKLGIQISVHQKEDFDGSYTVSYSEASEVVLGKSVCDLLLVEILDN